MSHKSLLVFATLLPSDEDFDEITLAAALFIIYFCNKISISYLFHCTLAPVKPIQILFWMYSLCLYLKQYIEKYRRCRAAELAKPKGETDVLDLLLPQVPRVAEQMFSKLFQTLHGNGQTGWKYYFRHIKNSWVWWADCWRCDWPVLQTQVCWRRCATKTRQY